MALSAKLWLAVGLVAGCSRDEASKPVPTAPWPASSTSAGPTARAAALVRYVIEPQARASFVLKGRDAAPSGRLRVARGELEIDVFDLSRTRGQIAMDLASIVLDDASAELARSYTRRAQNWLDVGSSRPEAERERLRWARFSITSIEKLSAEAAHDGKLEKRPQRPDGGGGDAGIDGGLVESIEVRAVTLSARGELVLHDRKVEQVLELRALFHYAAPAAAGSKPTRMTIQTRRPFVVSLTAHDIKPRDDTGVFVAQDMKLLGREVGHNAQVELEVSARPAG
jgi:hypothetical protein